MDFENFVYSALSIRTPKDLKGSIVLSEQSTQNNYPIGLISEYGSRLYKITKRSKIRSPLYHSMVVLYYSKITNQFDEAHTELTAMR